MKVLLIWEEIPKETRLYSLEGELVELAVAANGSYINGNENAAVTALSSELKTLKPIGASKNFDLIGITGHTAVVIAGIYL